MPLQQHGLSTYRRQNLTILAISIITAFSLILDKKQPSVRGGGDGSLQQRDSTSSAAGTGAGRQVNLPSSHVRNRCRRSSMLSFSVGQLIQLQTNAHSFAPIVRMNAQPLLLPPTLLLQSTPCQIM